MFDKLIEARAIVFLKQLIVRGGWRPVHYAIILLIHAGILQSGEKAGVDDWNNVFFYWADALRLSIVKYHQFPWWNPWSLTGQPLFADPQTSVLTPDTLLSTLFGSIYGLKLSIVLYFLVGYEGCRFLCRDLFGSSRFVESLSIIPALLVPLALHFNEGHIVFVPFFFFPWLLAFALSWLRSAQRSVGFGIVVGCYFLSYIHYTVIMAFTLVLPIVLIGLWRFRARLDTWMKAALVLTTALGLSLLRIASTLAILIRFPRHETGHYPISYTLSGVLGTLVEPLQNRHVQNPWIAGLKWWELGSYVGCIALILAYEGFRRKDSKFLPLYVGAVLCLVLAWNNRDPWFPSYWMHFYGPWKYMIVITRWRLFACFFILVGAVHGLLGVRAAGRGFLAGALGMLVVLDLSFHAAYAYEDTFTVQAPPFVDAPDPPITVRDIGADSWRHLRMNQVSTGTGCSILGWGLHYPNRTFVGHPEYVGEFYGSKPVTLESWTPNRIVLTGTPGDIVTLNINPSNYWIMNGERLFPNDRAIEIAIPFRVTVPPEGRMVFTPRPPYWQGLLAAQGALAVAAIMIYLRISRRKSLNSDVEVPV